MPVGLGRRGGAEHEERAPGAPLLMLWVIFALLTGAAVLVVLWPLARAPATTDARELDVAFYKAQAAEIDRDVSRGVIGEGEAGVARNEAARRLMAASRIAPDDVQRASPLVARWVALAVVLLVPAGALGLYTYVGEPNMPDEPLEARLKADPGKMDMAAIMAKLEQTVAANPKDGRGWALLARLYTQLGRIEGAAKAYGQEIRILGPSEERLSALGEDETTLADGHVTPEAVQHFEAAAKLDPRSPRARFYLALAAEQGGDKTKAVTIWKAIVADGPTNAPWIPTIKARIAAATGEPLAPPPMAMNEATARDEAGDGQAKMAAAVAAMPAGQQQQMIHGMVDRLADRLKTKGDDLEGWLRLVRAYGVLQEQDKAKSALADARRNFAADDSARRRLDALAHELGLES